MRPEVRDTVDAVFSEIQQFKKYILYSIKSSPPTLTVEDIDRFFRLNFNSKEGELSTPGAYTLVKLTQGRCAPFPFMSQSRSVQEAIIAALMCNHESREVLLEMVQ